MQRGLRRVAQRGFQSESCRVRLTQFAAAVAALAPNTRKAYGSAGSGWERWAADHGRQALPAVAADVADYLEARHAGGALPATTRAAVAKVHQVSGLADPTADGLCRDVLRAIGRDGRDRGRGQVAGIGWAHAEAATSKRPGNSAGPLFRQVRRGGHAQRRAAGRRQHLRHSAPPGSRRRQDRRSLRSGSAVRASSRADGASVAELWQAGGWKSPPTPGVSSGAKPPPAGRSLGTATRWARGDNLGHQVARAAAALGA